MTERMTSPLPIREALKNGDTLCVCSREDQAIRVILRERKGKVTAKIIRAQEKGWTEERFSRYILKLGGLEKILREALEDLEFKGMAVGGATYDTEVVVQRGTFHMTVTFALNDTPQVLQ